MQKKYHRATCFKFSATGRTSAFLAGDFFSSAFAFEEIYFISDLPTQWEKSFFVLVAKYNFSYIQEHAMKCSNEAPAP